MKQTQLKHVMEDCIRRRANGEIVTDESLMAAHPDLMPKLAEQLRRLHVIEEVQHHFDEGSDGAVPHHRVRCPHCHEYATPADGGVQSRIVCAACRGEFELADESPSCTYRSQDHIGHFQLLDRLGGGAFGTVWRARDLELDRLVAVKIPRQQQLSAEDAERVIREARTAAQLTHPNIVQVHYVGHDGDMPYIVTDLIEGPNLADWIAAEQPSARESAELCAELADALHQAHQKGVVHRDLKPSNVLIRDDGRPCLMDFGLAKQEAGDVTITLEGKLLGTPAYMSPEQARGAAHQADSRSDVYSLGVILYELLTGERPFRGNTRMLLHQILHEDAPAPRKLDSRVPRELETICLKCLEKSADRRYQTARGVAADLRRFLAGKPIHARPISFVGQIRRWFVRKPGLATSAVMTVLLLLVLGVAGPIVALLLASQSKLLEWRSYVADMHNVYSNVESADINQALDTLKTYANYKSRGFEWRLLSELCRHNVPVKPIPYAAPGHVAFSPNGKTLAVSGRRPLLLYDLEDKGQTVVPKAHTYLVKPVAFSPDGGLLATGGWDGVLKLWNVRSKHEQTVLNELTSLDTKESMQYDSLAFSPDGRLLATNSAKDDTDVPIWDVTKKIFSHSLVGHKGRVTCVAFARDGKLATGSNWQDRSIRLWNPTSREQIGELGTEDDLHKGTITSVTFSPSGNLLASASEDDTVKLWDVETGNLRATLQGHSDEVLSVAFSYDGAFLASAGSDGVVNVWNMKRVDEEPLALKGHAGSVLHVAFSPTSNILASAGVADQRIHVWDLTKKPRQDTFRDRPVWSRFRGDVLASWSTEDLPSICDDSLNEQEPSMPLGEKITCKVWSPDRRVRAVGHKDGRVELNHIDSNNTGLPAASHDGPVWNVLFSPDSRWLVAQSGPGAGQNTLNLWDVSHQRLVETTVVFEGAYPIFSADSKMLAAITVNEARAPRRYAVKTWRLTGDEWTAVNEFPRMGEELPYFSLAFSAKGDLVAAGSVFGEITVWDIVSGEERWKHSHAHTSNVFCLAFSPNDERLASCSHDRTVKLWNVATGDEMIALKDSHSVLSVGFSPRGTNLACANKDRVIRLWRTRAE